MKRHKRYKFDLDDTPSSSFVAIDPRLPALYSEAANLVGIEGPRGKGYKVVDRCGSTNNGPTNCWLWRSG